MMRKLLASCLVFCLGNFTVLTGCARQKALAEHRNIVTRDIAIESALAECQTRLRPLEEKATGFRWATVGVALLGSIAGAVLVPAFSGAALANKALISALGGVAGVTNTAQTTMRESGLSHEPFIQERDKVRAILEAATSDYIKAKEANDSKGQEAAVIRIKSICLVFSAFNPPENDQ